MMLTAYERELARSVDADQQECPDCYGHGYHFSLGPLFRTWTCRQCDGTGTVPADEYDAMDEADSLFERAGDR